VRYYVGKMTTATKFGIFCAAFWIMVIYHSLFQIERKPPFVGKDASDIGMV